MLARSALELRSTLLKVLRAMTLTRPCTKLFVLMVYPNGCRCHVRLITFRVLVNLYLLGQIRNRLLTPL